MPSTGTDAGGLYQGPGIGAAFAQSVPNPQPAAPLAQTDEPTPTATVEADPAPAAEAEPTATVEADAAQTEEPTPTATVEADAAPAETSASDEVAGENQLAFTGPDTRIAATALLLLGAGATCLVAARRRDQLL